MIEQTVTESNGWWDLQTMGCTFSKGHLGISTRGSASWASCAQAKLSHSVEGDKVPVDHTRKMLGKPI